MSAGGIAAIRRNRGSRRIPLTRRHNLTAFRADRKAGCASTEPVRESHHAPRPPPLRRPPPRRHCARRPLPAQTPPDPDEARIADVITASHILTNEGILNSFGHVSARSGQNPDHFFMPRAMPPALVTRADIVEVGLDCKPVDADAPRLNGERFIHCRVYRARADVASVIHSHDLAVIPFGLANIPLRPVVAQAGFLPPQTPLFEVRDHNAGDARRGVLVLNEKLGDGLAGRSGPILSC